LKHWNFSLQPHYGPGVNPGSNRNEYHKYFLGGKGGQCVGLTTLLPSCADCLGNLGASTSWNPKGLSRTVQGLLYLYRKPNRTTVVLNLQMIIHFSTYMGRLNINYGQVFCT
jgi:hypothetical protein